MISPQPYLTVASILTGFCISVFMFRIQRELSVRDRHPDWPNWLAWADYLIVATIVLSVIGVILPLVAVPTPSRTSFSVAAASCAAASLLLLAYPSPFSITTGSRSAPGAPNAAKARTSATRASRSNGSSWSRQASSRR